MGVLSHWVWPLMTAVLGFVYVGLLVAQWVRRRKMHQIMWAIGFLFYAVAAVMEFWSEYARHWDPTVYRFYIVLAASLVGFLGNGTAYLVFRRRTWADAYLAYNLLATAVFLYGTLTADLRMDFLVPGIVVGGKALGASGTFPRFMSVFLSVPGSLMLLGGSTASILKFWPNRAYRYRVWANVMIIVGTLMIAGAGSMARAGSSAALYTGEMVASAVLLAGFLMAGTLEKGAAAARAEHAGHPHPETPAPHGDVAPIEPPVADPAPPPRVPGDERGRAHSSE